MKRYTLCKVCLCILAPVFLLIQMGYLPRAREAGGGSVTASGRVVRIEEKESDSQKKQIILSLRSVTFCGGTFSHQTNKDEYVKKESAPGILCYLSQGEEIPCYGEQVVVSGWMEPFSGKRNPGGFDAAAYYRAQGNVFSLKKAVIVKRGGEYDRYRQTLYRCRQFISAKLEEICGADAGIMRAMLLGDKAGLLPEVKRLYQKGGISHILAISGLHISFLGMGLYRLLRKVLPVPAAGGCAGLFLLSYVIMTGGSPSAMRAALMYLMRLLADLPGRSYDRMTALSVSALLLAAGQPLLLQQSGFLLSYGAILGLELVYPILSRLWTGRAAGLFLAGISVFAVTLPVLLLSFFEFPIYSFFLNLLVIPLMGLVMALGLLSLLAGMLLPGPGRLLFLPVHLILWLFQACCGVTERLPGNSWLVGQPDTARIVMYYTLLIIFCLMRKYVTKCHAALLLAGGLWILTGPVWTEDRITVLDVGQGDSILLQDRDGEAMLIDCGSTSEKGLAEYTLLPCLKSQGIGLLSYVFLTHMDADHISGVEELIEDMAGEVSIGTLVLPALGDPDEDYRRMVLTARRAGIRICSMGAGDELEAGRFSFFCLHPTPGGVYADRNDGSLVLYVERGSFSALFTGDLDGEAEGRLTETLLSEQTGGKMAGLPEKMKNGHVTLLKAGHHGSKVSCQEAFLDLWRPEMTVISCGEKNSYGHPAEDTLKRIRAAGSRVYVTKDTGAVRLRLQNKKIRIDCYWH